MGYLSRHPNGSGRFSTLVGSTRAAGDRRVIAGPESVPAFALTFFAGEVEVDGIPSAEAFGSATVDLAILDAGGVASAEALGAPTLDLVILDAGGIASAEGVPAPAIVIDQFVDVDDGIESEEAFEVHHVMPVPGGFGPQADEPAAPGVDVELAWAAYSNPDLVASAVLRQEDLEGAWAELARVEGTSYLLRNLELHRSYEFAVAPVSRSGARSPEAEWSRIRVVPALLQREGEEPKAPASFSAAQEEAVVHFAWQPSGDGITEAYELREGPSWEQAAPVAVDVPGLRYDWPWRASGARTFWIRGRDKAGRLGPPATFLLAIEALETHVTANVWDEAAGGFAGTKTHVEVVGGELRPEEFPDAFGDLTGPFGDYVGAPFHGRYWPEGFYETAQIDLGQQEAERFEVEVSGTQALPALGFASYRFHCLALRQRADGARLPVSRRDFGGFSQWSGASLLPLPVDVWINTKQDGAGAWDGWRRWVQGIYPARYVQFRLRLRSEGMRFASISGFKVTHRRLNKKQEGDVVVGPDDPVDVVFATPFVLAPKVDAQVIGYPGAAIVENVTPTGFRLRPGAAVFDADPAVFAPTVHWSAKGP